MINISHATMALYILLLTVLTKNTAARITANYAFNHRRPIRSWHKRNYFKGIRTDVSDIPVSVCDEIHKWDVAP